MSRIPVSGPNRRAAWFALLFLLLLPSLALAHGEAGRPQKNGILLAFFGTSVPEGEAALKTLEAKVTAAYPAYEVRRAYSSNIIRKKLAESGQHVDSTVTALARMMDDGFTHVAVLTSLFIPGEEYHGLARTVAAFDGLPKGFDAIALSQPLLSDPAGMPDVAAAFLKSVPAERKPGEAVVFMGHGTHHPGNIFYPGLQYYLAHLDPNTFVGTVEGTPGLDDIVAELKKRSIKKVCLIPLMAVAGDHAQNDMAGDEPDSWKSQLTKVGIEAVPVMKGLAEFDSIVDMWIEHLKVAMAHLK